MKKRDRGHRPFHEGSFAVGAEQIFPGMRPVTSMNDREEKQLKSFLVEHITGYNLTVQQMNPRYLLIYLYPGSS